MFTNNNASQTLFRFASTRNAELSDPKNKERRFIFRDYDSQKGVIDARVEAGESLQKVCENPTGLTIETEQSLKLQNPVFYELAVWVARNKVTADKVEFDQKIKEYRDYLAMIMPVSTISYSNIWDNLIYQVVTQKDFYAKETLMQFLHLNHILTVYSNGNEEIYNDVIKAKVVLPRELFKSDTNTSASSGLALRASGTVEPNVLYNDKSMKFAEAKVQLKDNENLDSVLKNIEQNYRKEYQLAYKEASDAYEKNVAPVKKEYKAQLEEADSRKKVIEARIDYLSKISIANPELFFKDERSQEELKSLQEELGNTVSMPEIPELNFEFRSEVKTENLLGQLTDIQKNTLNKILQGSSSSLDSISTFTELNQLIYQNNQILQQTVLDNTVISQQVSTTVGGVVIPVINSLNTNGWIPYSVKTYNRGNSDWFIMLTIENYTHNIVSGSYKVTINGTEISSANIVSTINGVTSLYYNGSAIPASQTLNTGGFVLQGEVILDDGKTYSLSVTLIRDNSDMNTVLKQGAFKGSAALTLIQRPAEPENPGTPENPGNPENPGTSTGNQGSTDIFIPSGFGMKNIGITDYKKVEQSTYCYMEGDVAHIENIMAREYKERATRRLKRSESQTTTSSETEKEKLTDTTSTERHEMQSEVAKILQESRDFAAQAGFSASWGNEASTGKYGLSVSANYATHNSKEESNRQAVTDAKDITARALDRIVTKIKEERIDKILEEYEENNKHGFDNTKGSSHVVGVYRWVDKVVKNQIYNYGKRMMFEFMVPEPAKLHSLGMKISNNTENQLIKPVDPRESVVHKLENFSSLEDEIKLKYWLSKYNVEIDKKPEEFIFIGKSFNYKSPEPKGNAWELASESADVEVPGGYKTISARMVTGDSGDRYDSNNPIWSDAKVLVGNIQVESGAWNAYKDIDSFRDKIPVSYSQLGLLTSSVNISIKCQLTQEAKNEWLQKTFNKIIEAYEMEMDKYNQALADAKALEVQIKGSNPGFYRKIENTILRRNCISYMLDQHPNVDLTFGKKKYYTNDGGAEETFLNTDIKVDEKLDQYVAFVKFMEQAFEWEIMSYYFYPYYWGERKSWGDLYQFDDNDPVFRAFMQSGMARVIVTVRPGFEETVRHFFSTGQIWNGGEVPVIDDPLFLSIVDEMRSPKATKEGEPWREKIPTALTILQADSIGLKVEKALPCNCEPGVKFDDNLGEMCGSNFELNQNQVGQTGDKLMEITFNNMDQLSTYKTIGDADDYDFFPKVYECLGNKIIVNRDATWLKTDSINKMYKALADEISQIEGLESYPTGENGITFKINVTKIKNFSFKKGPFGEPFDVLRFTVNTEEEYLKIYSPEFDSYGERILDKDGQKLSKSDFTDKALLSKFLI
ncbi:hypothetical protein GCM10023210_27670 [Chryseobacterium ginsengisoli]|uniref:Uncharacterized protein n=1 Tax=Chryseobacterium ginsengisoli TaxID=363853 RepID=A0ABP9MG46_9FLAO